MRALGWPSLETEVLPPLLVCRTYCGPGGYRTLRALDNKKVDVVYV